MEQKFVSFEEAVEKLGISAERLHELREGGDLRAYRDGKSWKFRTDEIQGMVEGGVPEPSPPSDIGLVSMDELVEAAPIEVEDDELGGLELMSEEAIDKTPEPTAEPTAEKPGSEPELELELGDLDELADGSELELDLEGMDDTVTAGASDLSLEEVDLDGDQGEAGPSDSILLSEEELGVSVSGSPSTIIGKDKMSSSDDDLELALDDDVAIDGSDVKSSSGASDVLSSGIAGSGVLDELEKTTGGTSAFKDLDELEIDLAAESGPALAAESADLSVEGAAARAEMSDLELMGDSGVGAADTPVLEVEEDGSGADIELADDDDLILDASGSDLSLDSSDSGINLISPADSGLALDDIPLEMGGSAILSSLSLEGSDPEISLIGDSAVGDAGEGSMAELQTDDDFQLTPMSESVEDEGDSSSQVIALDADMEDFGGDAVVLEEDAFAEEDDVAFAEDFAEAPAGDLDMSQVGAPAPMMAATPETPYTLLNILGLGSAAVLVLLGGTMMLDMMRNIWSWNEPYSLNSSLMEAILGLIGQ